MASCCSLVGAICWWQIHDTAETTENLCYHRRGGSSLVLSAVSCSSSSWLSCVNWAPCACVCVFALHLCRLCRNPLNVSSSQSKSWGEPAWPAEFRWVLLVLSHPRCSVCCYQFNLSVCVFYTCAHTHSRCNGWKCKCQVFSLNKASETIR